MSGVLKFVGRIFGSLGWNRSSFQVIYRCQEKRLRARDLKYAFKTRTDSVESSDPQYFWSPCPHAPAELPLYRSSPEFW